MALVAGWRKLSTDKLQALADTLEQKGMWEEFETVQGELELREDEESMFGPAYDTPSLEDRGIELGSYAS
jgi:hypothetical protein